MGKIFAFLFGAVTGVSLVMLYLHRSVFEALIKGLDLPKAPKGCPAFAKDGSATAAAVGSAPTDKSI